MQQKPYYFYLVGDGKEYRICRSSDNLTIAGAAFRTKHAAVQDAKRHIAKLERGAGRVLRPYAVKDL